MKGFVVLYTFAVTSAENAEQLGSPVPKLLADVYGPATPRGISNKAQIVRSEEYYARRAGDRCNFPIDLVIVQDSTGSFGDDFDQMREMQLKQMTDELAVSHPGSRFGLVSFKDRNVPTLGETFDYCHRVDLPLNGTSFEHIHEAYGRLWSNGGMDPAENQFGALIAAAETPLLQWSPPSSEAARLLVLSTDSWPHFDADGLNNYGMAENSGHLDENETAQCHDQYYPSPEQVQAAIFERDAYTAFLVFDGDYAAKVADSWSWFNAYLAQPPAFVEPLANDSSNFWAALSRVIIAMEHRECGETTTAAPSEPASTTEAPRTVDSSIEASTIVASINTIEAPTTVASTTEVLTGAPTEVPVSPVAPTETSEAPCPTPCNGGGCGCPEIVIRLRHKPAKLLLDVKN